jgi:translocation protein SEC62
MAQPGRFTPEQLAFLTGKAAEKGMSLDAFLAEENAKFEAFAKSKGMSKEKLAQMLEERRRGQGSPQPGQPGQQQQPGQPGQQQQPGVSPNPQQAQQGPPQQQMQRVAVNPGQPADPKALAVAKFLRSQALKSRTCILDGERKDMFKGMQPTPQITFKTIRSDQIRSLTSHSHASYPCPRVPRLRQSRRKKELPPPTRDRPRLSRGCL